MNIFLSNSTKYSICVKTNANEYFLDSDQTQRILLNDSDQLTLSILNNTDTGNSFSEKIHKSLKNLVLDVSCTYLIKNVNENDSIKITNEIFELEGNTLLLPFAYHYLNAAANDNQLRLVQCRANNAKAIKKTYFVFALLGDGGFDFVLNIFSIALQMHRIKKLCNDNEVFNILKSRISGVN